MFLFAHVGITLGAAIVASKVSSSWPKKPKTNLPDSVTIPAINVAKDTHGSISKRIGLVTLSDFLDIRILMIGSLLPDIIDKPLCLLGFGDGRSITHTLLVAIIILLIGSYIYKQFKKTWLLAINIGMFTHLVLDSMWNKPQTLLWPFYQWALPAPSSRITPEQIYVSWNAALHSPGVDIWELIGIVILIGFFGILFYEHKLNKFLLKGKI
jgi:membrane-bound metal-dependent hydrolase YbcI (DUF457 family)